MSGRVRGVGSHLRLALGAGWELREGLDGEEHVLLDPFKMVTQQPDTFNPLDWIDRESPEAIDDCRDLGAALVTRTGHESGNVDAVLDGDLDPFMEAFLRWRRREGAA